MRATTLRFDDDLWAVVEAEARRCGVSAAQFVRDATVMRATLEAQRRGDSDAEAAVSRLASRRGRRKRRDANPRSALHDPARLAALERLDLLDPAPVAEFDRYTALASKMLDAPVALVSLVDSERQVLKSRRGLGEPWASSGEMPLSHSYCQHTLQTRSPLVVSDAREHPLLRDNLAVGDLGAIAYAGAPIITPEGHALGTLCVIDHVPRNWTHDQVDMLSDLAAAVATAIELRAMRD
jgi:GAF domain-containing protein